jgi:hypothetical protein
MSRRKMIFQYPRIHHSGKVAQAATGQTRLSKASQTAASPNFAVAQFRRRPISPSPNFAGEQFRR